MKTDVEATANPSLPVQPIERKSLSEEVMERLLHLIEDGVLKPQERLPSERDMAAQFGVARNSIREAVRALALIGVLVIRPGDGIFVASYPEGLTVGALIWQLKRERKSMSEVLEARYVVEVDIAGLAAQRASRSEIDRLSALIEKMKEKRPDSEAVLRADLEFHDTLAAAARNSVLLQVAKAMRHLVEPATRKMTSRIPDSIPRAIDGHLLILEAIDSGDADAARQAMASHLEWAERLLTGEENGESEHE